MCRDSDRPDRVAPEANASTPAVTMFEVSKLIDPRMLVEIEAEATIG